MAIAVARAAREQTRPRVGAAVGVLSLAVFMSSLDLFIVNLAFPSIAREHPGTSLASLSWVLNGYTVVFAAVLVPAGRYADRLGRRRLFSAGLLLFTAGSALCALAPSVPTLVAARVGQAAGAGLMVPTSLSLLLAVVPAAQRARAIGTWAAVGGLAAAFGPVVGGLLVQVGWRSVFWVNVPVGVAALVATPRVLAESRDPDVRRAPDLLGATLLAAGIGLVALALVQAPGVAGLRTGLVSLLAVAALGAVALRSRRHAEPVVDPVLLRLPTFSGAFAASVLYYAGFGLFVLNSVEFLTGAWHYSAIRAGLAIAPGPLTVLPFARAVAPRLTPLLGGPGRVAALGCLLGAGAQGLWWLSLVGHPAYASHLLVPQIVGGAAVGLVIPSLLGAGTTGLPPARFGTGSGVLNMGRQIGVVIGTAALVGLLAARPGLPGFRDGTAVAVGFFLAAAVVCGALLWRRPAPA